MKRHLYLLLTLLLAMMVAVPAAADGLTRVEGSGALTVNGVAVTDSARSVFARSPSSENEVWFPSANRAAIGTKEVRRTVMIYIVGSDLESDNGLGTGDLLEIIESGVDLSMTNVVVAVGGSTQWHSMGVPAGCVGYYALDPFNPDRYTLAAVCQPYRGSMADPAVLSHFLSTASQYYPADRYDLILWDHGGGPLGGYGYDNYYNRIMSLKDISSALAASPFKRTKLECIVFDACLMGTIEVAAAMAPYADYMIASQEVIPGRGLDYTFLGHPNFQWGETKHAFRPLLDAYFDYYKGYPELTGQITLSLLDLSHVDEVEAALDAMFSGAAASNATLRSAMSSAAAAHAFGRASSGSEYDLLDVYDFANECWGWNPRAISSLSSASTDLVVDYRSNCSDARGISFYFPLYNTQGVRQLVSVYDSLNFADGYTSFLNSYSQKLANRSVSAPVSGSSGYGRSIAMPAQGGAVRFTYQMTDEQQERFVRASYVLLTPTGEGEVALVRGGGGVTVDENGLLSVEVAPFGHTISDSTGAQSTPFTLIEKTRSDEAIFYSLPFMLTRGLDVSVVNAQLLTTPQDPAGFWGHVLPASNGTGLAHRQLLEFEREDLVTLLQMRYTPTYDAQGRVTPFQQWPSAGTNLVYAAVMEVGDGLSIRWEPLQGEYYVQIICTDIYGEHFASDLMPLGE